MQNNPTCSNCGHTLYQHSTGECGIHRCPCKGYVASGVHVEEEIDGAAVTMFVSSIILAFLVGMAFGSWVMPW